METATQTKQPQLYAVDDELADQAGAIVYMQANGWLDLVELRDQWDDLGLDSKLLPNPYTPEQTLNKAMHEVRSGARQLVRPLANRAGYALVQEDAEGDNLDYDAALKAKVVTSGAEIQPVFTPENHPDIPSVQRHYEKIGTRILGASVGHWVWRRLAPTCDAIGLTGGAGGYYFVPRAHLDTWRAYTTATNNAAPDVRFYEIPAMPSEETVRAVLDAITHEAEYEIGKMQDDISDESEKELGKRALQTRESRCRNIRDKVERYEGLLGQALPDLRDKLEQLRRDVAAAMLLQDDD